VQTLRVMIADDEEPARERLVQILREQSDCEIVAIATSGPEAVRLIAECKPDVLFLDIKMPGLDGFEVLRQIAPEIRPITVFITAFDNYAIQAFETHGADYLLKPFSDERFEAALARVREYVRMRAAGELGRRLAQLLDHSPESFEGYWERIAIKAGGRVTFLNVSDVDWIEAAGVYVNFHVGSKTFLYRSMLGQIEKRLSPKEFVRVNRSAIVRVDRIVELQTSAVNREYSIVLKTGQEIQLSRMYRSHIESWLHQRL